MSKLLLLADEAIAQGAIDAGISGVYAYPGTPSTEITEYIQSSIEGVGQQLHCQWSANEKTAMEGALGMSYAGKRALVCMKHVGLNVAADAFINAAMTGINGGVVVVAADDPSMHSSQNEQDSRFYGKFAMTPILEPSNQQEAYDMVRDGFDLSESCGYPVLLRITTRLAHSRAGVETGKSRKQNELHLPSRDEKRYILLPGNARVRYRALIDAQDSLMGLSACSPYNSLTIGTDRSLAIIACGIGYNYLMENFPNGAPFSILKIGQYPIAPMLIEQLADQSHHILVLEEGMPLVEEQLKGFIAQRLLIKGRLDGTLSRDGELNADKVAVALGLKKETPNSIPLVVAMRPPQLCEGCGHRDLYDALNFVLEEKKESDPRVFGDIGCYTLGALPPYRTLHTCVEMGASITMAKGAADAGLPISVAVIGDSTFTHSGMTALLDCVNENSAVTIIISDNQTTGMTGGQASSATGRLESICLGLGVEPEHVRSLVPLKKNSQQMQQIIREEIDYQGVSVIIPCRECIQTLMRKKKQNNQ